MRLKAIKAIITLDIPEEMSMTTMMFLVRKLEGTRFTMNLEKTTLKGTIEYADFLTLTAQTTTEKNFNDKKQIITIDLAEQLKKELQDYISN